MTQTTTLSTASKATHKDVHKAAKRPDRFLNLGRSLMEGAAKQGKLLAALGVGVLVIAGAIGAWMSRKDNQESVARDALYGAEKLLNDELKVVAKELAPAQSPAKGKDGKPLTAPPAPGPEAIAFKSFDVNAKLPKGLAALKEVAEKHRGTRSGFEASMEVGELYMNHGHAALAEEWFKKGTEQAGSRLEKSLSWYALGTSLENTGKSKEAVEAYQKAVNAGEPSMEGETLLALARGLELSGQSTEAKNTYERILKDLPNTEYSRLAESFKAALK
jgi:tetratricopeptide (TPR) repeat protein